LFSKLLRLAEHPKKLIVGQYWKVLYTLVCISFTSTHTSSSTGPYSQRDSPCCKTLSLRRMARVLLRPAPQTRQNRGINSDTAWRCVCLGRVARGCSRRPTSTVHKETKRQRYHRAAAVAVACSLKKNVFTDVPSKQAFLGARPRDDPRGRGSSMRVEASAELEISLARASRRGTRPVSLRHLLFYNDPGKERRDGRQNGGQTVEERKHVYT
jgi:hypothetical protein